ncbi:accessory Sec system protein Asp1 [Hutsoniella sourekii]|uniref:accessory Sec system protein Asp1 n=1 Tax=Hutsoniella sourekii TaxID=87650 RepID=UPI00048515F1|nr:accessory Sec system protein Asp1 [Hutsoniella sourekii]
MYRFITAWYPSQGNWYDRLDGSSLRRGFLEFDDTVNQLRMFQEAGEAIEIMVLNYQPFLRSFLHRHELTGVAYWSLFDQLQGFDHQHTIPLNYWQIDWPEQANFLFMQYFIRVIHQGDLYAQVYLSEMGYLTGIDYFHAGQKIAYHEYDDRGYLSRIRYFQEDHLSHDDYLDREGQVVIRDDRLNGQVQVTGEASRHLEASTYTSMSQLIEEVIHKELPRRLSRQDSLVIASHPHHNGLLLNQAQDYSVALSLFQLRNPSYQVDLTEGEMDALSLLVTDRESTKPLIQDQLDDQNHHDLAIYSVTPFDTRLQLGKSQRLEESILLLKVDGLSPTYLQEVLDHLVQRMKQDDQLRVKLITDLSGAIDQETVESLANQAQANFHEIPALTDVEDFADKQESEDEESYVEAVILSSENDLMKAMEYARLVIDLGDPADLYTQIAAVSTGIPQLVRYESAYVTHQENGYLVNNLDQLDQALDYFLKGLKNWNQSLVHCVDKINTYYSGQLVETWKALLKGEVDG